MTLLTSKSEKNPNDLGKLHPNFSKERKEERFVGYVDVFCQNLVYSLENNSSFKNVLLNHGCILDNK